MKNICVGVSSFKRDFNKGASVWVSCEIFKSTYFEEHLKTNFELRAVFFMACNGVLTPQQKYPPQS